MTDEELQYLFTERVGIIMHEGKKDQDQAIADATYEIRQILVEQGTDFGEANIKVMKFRRIDGQLL